MVTVATIFIALFGVLMLGTACFIVAATVDTILNIIKDFRNHKRK